MNPAQKADLERAVTQLSNVLSTLSAVQQESTNKASQVAGRAYTPINRGLGIIEAFLNKNQA